MNKEQALALNDLLATDAYTSLEDDAARLTKLNTEPVGERYVTDLTLSSTEGIGSLAAIAVVEELEQTATTLQQSQDQQEVLTGKLLAQASARIKTSEKGLNLADANTLAIINQLAAATPDGPISTNKAALLAMVPTRAKRLLGRDATQADLDAARDVGSAKATYETALQSARDIYDAAVAAAL